MFAKPVNVLDVAARQVVVEVTVDAAVVPEGPAQVAVELLDDARTIASARVPAVITKAGQVTVTATLDGLGDITLWDTDHPRLYHVVATLLTVDGSSLPELRIDGYLGSVRVASRSLACDPSGDVLALAADDAEIDGDGVDATRLAFRAVDRYGAPRPYVTGQVTLEVEGPAVLISDNPFDFATGGAGAVWIRSRPGSRGTVTVRASHPSLGSAVASIRVREVRETGSPGRAVSALRGGADDDLVHVDVGGCSMAKAMARAMAS